MASLTQDSLVHAHPPQIVLVTCAVLYMNALSVSAIDQHSPEVLMFYKRSQTRMSRKKKERRMNKSVIGRVSNKLEVTKV